MLVTITLIFSFSIFASTLLFDDIEKQADGYKDKSAQLKFLLSVEADLHHYTQQDNARYWFLVGMAYERNQNLSLSIEALTRSIQLSQLNENKEQLVQSLIERSYSKYIQTYDEQDYCSDRKQALAFSENILNVDLKVRALVQYSFCFQSKPAQLAKGLELLDKALDLAKNHRLSANTQGMIYNSLGHIFNKNQLHEKAYQYTLSAYQQWSQVSDYQDMFNMLHTLTSAAINNLRFDLAKHHVEAMFLLAKEQPSFADFTFFSFYNAGLLAKSENNFEQSIHHYQQALRLQHTTQEKFFVRSIYENLAIIYFRINQLENAKLTLLEYKKIFPSAKIINPEFKALEFTVAGSTHASRQALFDVIDFQVKKRREFTHFAVQATANLHDDKINDLDNKVLQQNLEIKELNLINTQEEKQFIYYSLILVSIFVLSLLGFILYLLKIQRKFKIYARTDGLTGIANRRFILELGTQLLIKAKPPELPLSILLFDIDNFKQINDEQGHHVGDKAIKLIVKSAKTCLRKVDKIGRIGGDEFLLLLPETKAEEAKNIAERIRADVEKSTQQAFNDLNLKEKISVSIGIIPAGVDDSLEGLIIRADEALYQAKNLGRNVVVLGK